MFSTCSAPLRAPVSTFARQPSHPPVGEVHVLRPADQRPGAPGLHARDCRSHSRAAILLGRSTKLTRDPGTPPCTSTTRPEQKALRAELRAYFAKLVTPRAALAQLHGLETSPLHKQLIRQMGRDGWLGVGWPKEYGGQGSRGDRAADLRSTRRGARARRSRSSRCNTVGPTLMRHGTEEQKQTLPARDPRRRESTSRSATPSPSAGTDLASLKTSADARRRPVRRERHEDLHERRRRTPTTSGSRCAPIPTAPKHKGISILIVDTKRPGLPARADLHRRRRPHQHDLLRGRARSGRHAGRAGERRAGS